MRQVTSIKLAVIVAAVLTPSLAKAQITPDATLGIEASVVETSVVNGNPTQLIEGGAIRQSNLFHSFSEFNLAPGEAAYFASPSGITNILSRVTGFSASHIDGLLGVEGTANLFFLNPNGIFFGPGAKLDIRGSFLASTADSIAFTDGSEFQATRPETSLLTVSVPLGIQLNTQPQGNLTNQASLAIAPGQTLTLLGNTVLNTGQLAAPGGTVQILGNRVGLLEQATLDVSDTTAGGTVQIGGDIPGQTTLPRALRTFIGPDARIAADGQVSGGQVVIWSEEATAFYGHISAVGDEQGGLAEVSGKQDLAFQGTVDLSSASGQIGTLLLDPANIVIVNGAAGVNDNQVLTDNQVLFGDGAVNDTFEIAAATLESLSGNANLVLQATNDITVNDLTDDSLVFANGTGSIELMADSDRNGVGDFVMADTADTLFTNERAIRISGASLVLGNIDTGFAGNLTGLPISILPSGNLKGGAIALVAHGGNISAGNLSIPELGAGGEILANGDIAFGDYTGAALRAAATGSIAAGDITITGPDLNLVADGSGSDQDLLASSRAAILRAGVATVAGIDPIDGTPIALGPVAGEQSGNILVNSVATSALEISNEDGGPIILAAPGDITVDRSLSSFASTGVGDAGNGGAISIASEFGDITVNGFFIESYSLAYAPFGNSGDAGPISIFSESGDITVNGFTQTVSYANFAGNSGNGATISVFSGSGDINLGGLDSFSQSNEGDAGNGGDIFISSNSGSIVTGGGLGSGSYASPGQGGNAGNISIFSETGNVTIQDFLSASSYSISGNAGDGGNISVTSTAGNVVVDALSSISNSDSGNAANGGDILLASDSGDVTVLRSLSSYSFSELGSTGSGGDISLLSRAGRVLGGSSDTGTIQGLFAFSASQSGEPAQSGGTVTLAGSAVSNIDVYTFSSGGQSGNVEIRSLSDRLVINDLLLTTSGQVEIPDPVSFGQTISLNLSDFGQAGNTLITSAGDITFNNVEIQSSANGSQPAGGVMINSPGQVTFNNSQILSNANREGAAGRIDITANRLVLGNGGRLFAATSGSGDGGTIAVNATDAVLLGEGVQNFEPVISVEASGSGRPGNIVINTPNFVLSETARITATATATATNLDGGGSITLNANQMDLAGTVGIFAETQGQSPGGVLTLRPYQVNPDLGITLVPGAVVSASTTGSGNGGGLQILAPGAIAISGPGLLAVETSGLGRGGNITAESQRLRLSDGVTLSASTTGPGPAGDITFSLSEHLEINGSTVESSTGPGSTGIGGNIVVNAATTTLRNGGQIAVNSAGQGEGGSVTLTSDQLFLDRSRITANTRSSNGGNLTFNLGEVLLLRNGSLISTEAGTAGAGGDGGDITLNLPGGFIVAVPIENSDIRANAFEGNGGNVNVTARNLLGIAFRPNVLDTPLSDITASSQFGNNGTVNIDELNPDVAQDDAILPAETAPPTLAPGCRAQGSQTGSFVMTGRGGLPTNPADPLSADTVWQDLAPISGLDEGDTVSLSQDTVATSDQSPDAPIVEARSWTRVADGTVIFLAEATERPSFFMPMAGCQVPSAIAR